MIKEKELQCEMVEGKHRNNRESHKNLTRFNWNVNKVQIFTRWNSLEHRDYNLEISIWANS